MKFYSLTLLSAPLVYSAPYGSEYRPSNGKLEDAKSNLLSGIIHNRPSSANIKPRSAPRYLSYQDDELFNRPTKSKTSIHPLAGSKSQPSSQPEPPQTVAQAQPAARPTFTKITPRSFTRQSQVVNPASVAPNVNPDEMNNISHAQIPPTGDIDIFKSAFEAVDRALATASLQFNCDTACQYKIQQIKKEMSMLNTIDFRGDSSGNGVQTHHTHIQGNSNNNAGYTYPQVKMRVHSHKNTVGNDYAYYKFSGNSAGNYHIKPENANSEVFLDVFDTNMARSKQDFQNLFDQSEQMIREIDQTKNFNSVGYKYNLGRPGTDLTNPPTYVLAKIGQNTYVEDLPEETYNIGVFADDQYHYRYDDYGNRH